MITCNSIIKSYGQLKVLKGIDMQVKKGEVVAIVGASGAGKSTLLQILGTLDRPDSGQLRINNTEVFSLSDKALSAFRNKEIGFVFQFHHLLPEFTALENICIPAFIGGVPKATAIKNASDLLDFFKLADRSNHKPSELSGGEQQRIAVARALINRPSIVLADEPSGNLDSTASASLHQLFFELRDQMNQTFVIVTHNQALAAMADRTLTIIDGMISSTH